MSAVTPLINLKPTNPTQEIFQTYQKFGLQPYDRNPNDYLRFVAKIFTAWRDPEDKILNFDPYDNTYLLDDNGKNDILQATSDKSIVAYIDGFKIDYQFTRLTTDLESTDLTSADNVIVETTETITYVNSSGETITINKAKYGEYHRFIIKSGICFIDNQLVQITKDTEWWFRVPEIKNDEDGNNLYNDKGEPIFELGQFIVDQSKVYSLLPNKRYKIILSYEYVTQFESNSARIQFVTDNTAVDEPYLLLATFSTNEFGIVHQNTPVMEENKELFLNYVAKPNPNEPEKLLYYLKDIDNQYLDKKYMANHKNLFKHLQSQLLTILSDTKIANTFHTKEIKEEIDHSVSSGDFVYYDAVKNRWYPAIVSRQDFDKVHGLYLRDMTEGTDFLFTSGIIEIDNKYKIVSSGNMVLKNLIPGAEYFLVDDKTVIDDNAPFVSPFVFTINGNYMAICTSVLAKASKVKIALTQAPESTLTPFRIEKTFTLDPILGEQRIEQEVLWVLNDTQKNKIPKLNGKYEIINESTGLIDSSSVQFEIEFEMVLNDLEETRQNIINDFEANDLELTLDYNTVDEFNNKISYPIKITSSDTELQTMHLSENLIGPQKPLSLLLSVLNVLVPKDYEQFNLKSGDKFLDLSTLSVNMSEIKDPLNDIILKLSEKLQNDSVLDNGDVFGLSNKLALLGDTIIDIDDKILKLQESLAVIENNYLVATMDFQSSATDLQDIINEKRNVYLGYQDTKRALTTQRELLEQKFIAIEYKLDDLKEKRNSLIDTKASTVTNILNIDTVIDTVTDSLIDLYNELNLINNEIDTLKDDINDLFTTIEGDFDSIYTSMAYVADFDSAYYRVTNTSLVDYDLENSSKIIPRLLNNMQKINNLLRDKEIKNQEVLVSKTEYELELESYHTLVMNGSMTFAEKLIKLQNLNNKEKVYNDRKNQLEAIEKELELFKPIRKDLFGIFNVKKNLIKGELFAKINNNVYPNSTWATETPVTFIARIGRVSINDITFEFIYKQDTNEKMSITIPAGQLMASKTVYLSTYSTTNMDNGIPKWIAKSNDKEIAILNLNEFNDNLINNYIHTKLIGDSTAQKVFTLNLVDYNDNPLNRNGTPVSYMELINLFSTTNTMYNKQINREEKITQLFIKEQELEVKRSEIALEESYKNSLLLKKANGSTTVENYDAQIDNLNDLILYYTTTDQILNPEIPGTDISKDAILTKMADIDSMLDSNQPLLNNSINEYTFAINNLATQTEIMLGKYQTTITEIKNSIEENKEKRININVLYLLYKEKVNLLESINNNLNSVYSSGIFNGEWSVINSLPLNSFEYEDGLEHILLELVEQLNLIPYSSFNIPKKLNYVCSINGIAYPTDLQSWIFSKSSGKISTRRYPGATSVGIALNNNTLILNIQHNHNGDISEFLNVYGNDSDFLHQLTSIYNSKISTNQKTDILLSQGNLSRKLDTFKELLSENIIVTNRTINGNLVEIKTTLNEIEMDNLDILISNTNNRELVLRLIYSKFYGKGNKFDPTYYIQNNNDSESSYFDTIGNTYLNTNADIFDKTTNMDFYNYTKNLLSNAGSVIDLETLKDLFYRKTSLYKDRDILSYILSSLPEPLFNYQSREIELEQLYTTILLYTLQKERLNIYDNPDPAVLDDFENPAITDPSDLVLTSAEISNYTLMAENKQQEINTTKLSIDTKKIGFEETTKEIIAYNKYKEFYRSLLFVLNNYIEHTIHVKNKYEELKTNFDQKIIKLNTEFLDYYKRTDKLPNVMWDIFRITTGQRAKWNYTYLVLRIKGMQQELNDLLVSNQIQYSPINSKINELKIKKNKALTENNETLAFVYQTELDSILLKKVQFEELLDNYIEEFNIMQKRYGKTLINKELTLEDSYIISELYMQDTREYNLSYDFAPYPAYKEFLG